MESEPKEPRMTPIRRENDTVTEYAVFTDDELEGHIRRIPVVPSSSAWRSTRADGIATPSLYKDPRAAARELVQAGVRARQKARHAGTLQGKIEVLRGDAALVGNRRLYMLCFNALKGDEKAIAECRFIIAENERGIR